MTIGSEGTVVNPVTANVPISANPLPPIMGRQADRIKSSLRGKYGTAALNKGLYSFNVTAQTIPVVASGLVSVFSLWNPPSSGVLAEMVGTDIGQVLVTTVVDAVGWYFSSGNLALAGTFTTKAVALTTYFSGRVGDTPNGNVIPYTAYTHSGTPVRCDIIGSFGGVSDINFSLPSKVYDGKLWIPPGTVMSVAMTTAAGTASGLDVAASWIEWPFI